MSPDIGPAEAADDLERLRFRLQFILGPGEVENLQCWKTIEIRPDLQVTHHPDLESEHIEAGGYSVTLLGFLVDYRRPQDSNRDIVEGLLKRLIETASIEDVVRDTFELNGRWALILVQGDRVCLMHDATGLRRLHYTNARFAGPTWCASEAALLADVLKLGPPHRRLEELVACYERPDGQYWYPGDLTPYDEISQLLPNHLLELRQRQTQRFWPEGPLAPMSRETAIDRAADILEGSVKAAALRYRLAVTVTAGLDSRVILAACRSIRAEVSYFTAKFWSMKEGDADIAVPRRLLAEQGLPHAVVECKDRMREGLNSIYRGNVAGAREVYGPICQGHYLAYPDSVCVKGNAAEIARRFYHPHSPISDVTTSVLARSVGMIDREPVTSAFETWLAEARVAQFNYDLLDLFYWEQRMPCWQGMAQAENDFAQDAFTPFNCRALLMTLLAVDSAERSPPDYPLFRDLIEHLWPELLSAPINPQERRSLGSRTIRRLKRLVGHLRSRVADSPSLRRDRG